MFFWRSDRLALIALVLVPILTHIPGFLDFFKTDPVLMLSGLGADVSGALFPGLPLIDPSIGFYHQSLGTLAIEDILRGTLPWWNPYEGIGVPLAGEMNASPFYPLMALLKLPHGIVLINVAVQICTGLGTYAICRRLGLALVPSLVASIAYEHNGTFAWLSGGWGYAIPALPLLVLGLEFARSPSISARCGAFITIALAIAVSISAGFIEIAFLDGVFALGWAAVRLWQSPGQSRTTSFVIMLGGATCGVFLAAPILTAFFDYLRVAFVGIHDGSTLGSLDSAGLVQLILPYVFGPIFSTAQVGGLWGSVGGFGTMTLTILALTSLQSRFERRLKYFLATWIVASIGASFGSPLFQTIVYAIPFVKYTAFYRYANTSWEFALVLLAGFALHEAAIVSPIILRKRLGYASAVVIGALAMVFIGEGSELDRRFASVTFAPWVYASLAVAFVAMVSLLAAPSIRRVRTRVAFIGAIACVEAIAMFVVPMFSYPRSGHIEIGSVDFLRRHLGLSRFYSLGPIAPNYGSYFGISEVDYNDIPIAKSWADYVHDHLDATGNPIIFNGTSPVQAGQPTHTETFVRHLSSFENIGVKYIVTPPDAKLGRSIVSYEDATANQRALTLKAGDRISVTLGRTPIGRLEDAEVLIGNYGNSSDGMLSMNVCARSVCVSSRESVRNSEDDSRFRLHFDRVQPLGGGTLAITFKYNGGRHPLAIWQYSGDLRSRQHLRFNGRSSANAALHLRLVFAPTSSSDSIRRVYHDRVSEIYELAASKPYFSAPNCALEVAGRERVRAKCKRSSMLHRSELAMAGWTAVVNGETRPTTSTDGLFQDLSIPAGPSTIQFSFTPPFIGIAIVAAGLGLVALAISMLILWRKACFAMKT